MLSRIEVILRGVRRIFSRSEWAIRLLGLSRAQRGDAAPGLILIQIDGLSYAQGQRALRRGRLPFLRRLLEREHYTLYHHYSGQPASTPAAQAELFYGIQGAMPAFSFFDRAAGRVFTMYERAAAEEMERRLQAKGEGLLAGGSAYTDIFTGGAAESHFCASSLGWSPTAMQLRQLVMLPLLMLIHLDIWVRTALLMAVELALSLIDCIRGTLAGKTFFMELQFILTRVLICILLRELVTAGAKIDLARGLPVIHVNFIGYDEQAHRRGPSSRFAHWSLRGIDAAIAGIWQAAHRSTRRAYDVWVYSDHGQEDTVPYARLHGRTVQEAIASIFGLRQITGQIRASHRHGVQSQRVNLLGGRMIQRLFAAGRAPELRDGHRLIVTAMGSLGHIYPQGELAADQRRALARALVTIARIPLVLTAAGPETASAWTESGVYTLPDEAAQLFGPEHPFLQEVAGGLVDICHHPDAGAFVILGWRRGQRPVSFPLEHGSHTGPGVNETDAFALLPVDAPLPPLERRPYLRPWDLRVAAQHALRRPIAEAPPELRPRIARTRTFRVMTYNIHRCIGMDGTLRPERIARVISRYDPDAVALQEVDVGVWRTGVVDQGQIIAEQLGMSALFQPALQVGAGGFGNVVMSRYPMGVIRAGLLPRLRERARFQPRAALWAAVDVHGVLVQLINSHLSLWARERLLQVETLLGPDWLGHPSCEEPVLLCGDFNALPESLVCQRLGRLLRDAQRALSAHRPRRTWSGRYPFSRIDHVFIGPGVEVVNIEVPNGELEQVASDHLPLIVEIRLPLHGVAGA